MTVHVNFGAEPLAALPFKCHMINDAAAKDASVVAEAKPKDGKYEVVFPVGLPDEGTFQWLDMFHEKNPGYTEISSRALLAWAEKSGLTRKPGHQQSSCNDKPKMNLSIKALDDGLIQNFIYS